MSEFERVTTPAKKDSNRSNDEEIEDGEEDARLEVTKHMGKSFPLLPGKLENLNGVAPAAARSNMGTCVRER
jgi:hypothetical protein